MMSDETTPGPEAYEFDGEGTDGDVNESLKAAFDALEAENAALKEQMLRIAAEAENTKRRAERESNDARAYAITLTDHGRDVLDGASRHGERGKNVAREGRAPILVVRAARVVHCIVEPHGKADGHRVVEDRRQPRHDLQHLRDVLEVVVGTLGSRVARREIFE